jgi:HSP90 family molecular chaperone
MTDPIDEYLLSVLQTYQDHKFINIASSDSILPALAGEQNEKKQIEKDEKTHKAFL